MPVQGIPGPFDFLRDIGEAVGKFGVERQKREEKDREQANTDIGRAVQLFQLVGDPSLFTEPSLVQSTERGGVSRPTPPKSSVGVKRETDVTTQPGEQAAVGAEQAARVDVAGAAGSTARATSEVFDAASLAAKRRKLGVTPNATAQYMDALELSGLQGQALQLELDKAIDELTLKALKGPEAKGLRTLVAQQNLGLLPLLTARIQSASIYRTGLRQEQITRARLVGDTIRAAQTNYKTQLQSWNNDRRNRLAQLERDIRFDEDRPLTEKERTEFDDSYTQQFPEPNYETVLRESAEALNIPGGFEGFQQLWNESASVFGQAPAAGATEEVSTTTTKPAAADEEFLKATGLRGGVRSPSTSPPPPTARESAAGALGNTDTLARPASLAPAGSAGPTSFSTGQPAVGGGVGRSQVLPATGIVERLLNPTVSGVPAEQTAADFWQLYDAGIYDDSDVLLIRTAIPTFRR